METGPRPNVDGILMALFRLITVIIQVDYGGCYLQLFRLITVLLAANISLVLLFVCEPHDCDFDSESDSKPSRFTKVQDDDCAKMVAQAG